MKKMGDYQNHYLKKGVFEKFIDTSLKVYGLDTIIILVLLD